MSEEVCTGCDPNDPDDGEPCDLCLAQWEREYREAKIEDQKNLPMHKVRYIIEGWHAKHQYWQIIHTSWTWYTLDRAEAESIKTSAMRSDVFSSVRIIEEVTRVISRSDK